MSQNIWTQCGGKSNLRTLECDVCRVVENQYQSATRKLVDTSAEHDALEEALESVKPPARTLDDPRSLHFLLSTPFRYPPLEYGSRFGSRDLKGIWYGALEERTALAETAYYRLRFLNDTKATIFLQADLTLFWTSLRSKRAVDLTAPSFARHQKEISDKSSYKRTQPLGKEMRDAGATFCQYVSARDNQGGVNVGVFSPSAFARPRVTDSDCETWQAFGTRLGIEFRLRSFSRDDRFLFKRADFEVKGRLPIPES